MTLWSTNYKGYTIHGNAAKRGVTYQSPAWPADPRIVKAPSLETAKRRIREELRRIERHGLKNVVYLAQAREEVIRLPARPAEAQRTYWVDCWRIIDADKRDLIQPYFKTVDEAREFAHSRGWALLEHFDY